MDKKIDNLHLYEDLQGKKHRPCDRFLYGLSQYFEAWKIDPLLLGIQSISIIMFCAYIGALIRNGMGLPLGSVINLSSVVLFILLALTIKGGACIARKHAIKLYSGIRDCVIFFFPLLVFSLYFFVSFYHPRVSGALHFYLITAFLVFEVMVGWVYVKRIASKKLFDLDIPFIMDADSPLDILLNPHAQFEKRQVFGDARNSLVVNGKKGFFKLREKQNSFHCGIALAESTLNYNSVFRITLSVASANSFQDILLFSRVFDLRSNYVDRKWIECNVTLDWSQLDFSTHQFFITIEDVSGQNKSHGGVFVSEPRVNKKSANSLAKKVILIIADSLRQDHLSCYGYSRTTSANLDLFSRDCVRFRNVMSQGEWTLPSIMSFLTSMYPSSHTIYHASSYQRLNPDIKTLPQILREHGFITRSFYTHKRLVSNEGFARGCDSRLFRHTDKENNKATSDDVLSEGIDALELYKQNDLFLLLHFFDTHQPCNPPSPYAAKFDATYDKRMVQDVRKFLLGNNNIKSSYFSERDILNLTARYDAEIYRQDIRFGMFIDYLKKINAYDEAMIIFTADHGMLLNDHNDLATIQLFDESLSVPLLIKFPKSSTVQPKDNLQQCVIEANLAVMPTILDVLGIPTHNTIQGKSLLDLLTPARKANVERFNFALSESLFQKRYSVSLRSLTHRYTAKSEFNPRTFADSKFVITSEQMYEARPGVPERLLKEHELNSELSARYKTIVGEHVAQAKKNFKKNIKFIVQ